MNAARRSVLHVCSVCAIVLASSSAASAAPRDDAARRGADWIVSEQQDDGGFFASGQRVDQTAETLSAAVAGGTKGRPVNRALAHIRRNGTAGASRGAYTGRIVAALVAADEDPRSFGGVDYVAKLQEQYDEASGRFDAENLFSNLQGANGSLAAGVRLPAQAIAYIHGNECSGGGFGYENGCAKGADVDTTAWAINVLVASGHKGDEQVGRARAYLLSVQQSDGGFGFTKDKATSADSTGLVLSAISALEEKATSSPWAQPDGDDPLKAILPLQNSDGSFRFISSARKGNALSTTNAVPGLAGVAYPVPRSEQPTKTPRPSTSPSGGSTARSPAPAATNATGGTNTAPRGTTGTSPTPRASASALGSASATAAEAAGEGAAPSVLPSPSASPGVVPPFAQSASQETNDGNGGPDFVEWGGIAVVAAIVGGGSWWLYKRNVTA